MSRRKEEERITGGRFVQPTADVLLPPERAYRIQAGRFVEPAASRLLPHSRKFKLQADFDNAYHFGSIAADASNAIVTNTDLRFFFCTDASKPEATEITEAAEGDTIYVAFNRLLIGGVTGYVPSNKYRVVVTAMQTGVAYQNAWTSYVVLNGTRGVTDSWPVTALSHGTWTSRTMIGGNLNLRMKIWVRGDQSEEYPPVGASWQTAV